MNNACDKDVSPMMYARGTLREVVLTDSSPAEYVTVSLCDELFRNEIRVYPALQDQPPRLTPSMVECLAITGDNCQKRNKICEPIELPVHRQLLKRLSTQLGNACQV
jgi:hypothetical protein